MAQIRVIFKYVFFIFLLRSIYYGHLLEPPDKSNFVVVLIRTAYSLEVPCGGTFNGTHNICFLGETRKISIIFG